MYEACRRGEALGSEPAPFAAGRGSHRKARDLHNAALCTDCFCGRPALGAKLFGHRAGAVRRGSRLLQKSVRPVARRRARTLWEPRPRGEALGAEPAPFAAGRGSHKKRAPHAERRYAQTAFVGAPPSGRSFLGTEPAPRLPQKMRATCTTQHHARAQFVGGPPSGRSFSGTEPAPFAAGRASHKKKRAACIRRPPTKKNRSARQCGGYCDSTSVTAWRNTPVRSCGLPGSSRSIRSELPRQTSLPSFAS